jgi:hypothetical protein
VLVDGSIKVGYNVSAPASSPKGRPTRTPPVVPPRIPRRPGGLPIRAQRYCPGLRPELFPVIGPPRACYRIPGILWIGGPQKPSMFSVYLSVCVERFFLRSPGQAPYRAKSACAKRAAYPDPSHGLYQKKTLKSQSNLVPKQAHRVRTGANRFCSFIKSSYHHPF